MTRTPSRTRTRTTRSSEHTARRPLMHSGFTSHLWLKIASCVIHVIHACALVVGVLSCLSSSLCPLFLPRLTVLLPALPDVHLSAQREVHVKPPVLPQLGERGHIRLRHTPHNHCTSTPHRSETNGIAERAVRRVKEGTSAVLLQSGLNETWWADSMELLYLSAKRHRFIV